MKIAFLDRDGTIIKDYPDERWTAIHSPEFVKGAVNTLKTVISKDYEIIIITNQYIIHEGFITFGQYEEVTAKMLKELTKQQVQVLDIFYCPHGRNEGCDCLKPRDGMIRMALEKYPEINLKESFIVGDSRADVELAANLNIRGFGIRIDYRGKNIETLNDITELPDYL
ncbi:D-glycero-D-manno-heptose 1,7-bisphosphate phosphatase [Evansella caseinilytica]|uniref:D,D-heptose 1,7-bisphosphate phosphatase n=1 Tax=Evansella caseinilytica TaxID=1503961 RepID=A0A1H3HAG0_9BACI|nr:HAD-IIIA family hydrolase [Evansella caseinilytica]SDY12486.1 D-glycero-D-manno-heptose 1,7-bisphosphate phosphatase [Evansella caseinilytica]